MRRRLPPSPTLERPAGAPSLLRVEWTRDRVRLRKARVRRGRGLDLIIGFGQLTRRHREAKQATSRSTRSYLCAAPPERGCVARQFKKACWPHIPQRKKYLPSFRSEEHTSELQSLMRISYAVFCL